MGQQNQEMDVESLQKSGRRRGGCLDIFLVISIIFLFVAVTAVAAGGVIVVMELRSARPTTRPLEFPHESLKVRTSQHTGDAPVYKMQNFVYLEASSNQLKNFTMHWAPVHYAAGHSVGSNFLFDSEQNSLMPEREGMYFIYIDLNLTCTFQCNAGLLSVSVGDKLTCEVDLPAKADAIPVSRKCWTVSLINRQGLLTQMTVSEGLENWKLEQSSSRFGMFLVD